MKLKNKKTGEIGLVHCDATMFSNKIGVFIDNNHIDLRNPYKIYTSLTKLNEEWEDYEENGNIFWYVDSDGEILCARSKYEGGYDFDDKQFNVDCKSIGNYFSSREEAELAVRKLKAWKRLKDFGCRLVLDDHFDVKFVGPDATKITSAEEQKSLIADYKLLFGGEE